MKKAFIITGAAVLALSTAAAFNWPQNEILSDSFNSYFGQLRGGRLSTSLVFSDSEDIKTCEAGKVIAVISEHNEDSELFESTLGNSVIVSHDDNMLTVYANLDEEYQQTRYTLDNVESGTPLGNCSNSAWQESDSCLEFQVVDTKNKLFINPRILMPRVGSEADLQIKNVSAVSKKGTSYNLLTENSIPAGSYSIYQQRQRISIPYKTTILINGYAVETISYDTLIEKNGQICTSGKSNYSAEQIYPSDNQFLLGEVNIPRGKVKMTVILSDILDKEKQMTFTFTAR